MFAYLIVFAIVFPNDGEIEVQKFNIWSGQTFDQAGCVAKANETAKYIAEFSAANIPDAHISIKLRCDPRETLPVA